MKHTHQYRMRFIGSKNWSEWKDCTKEEAQFCDKMTGYGAYEYETRLIEQW